MFVIDPIENLETGERTKPFCMICHPKTGSQSTRQALRQKYSARVVRGHHFFDAEECQRVVAEGGIVVSTVRNPFDLMVSWYFYSEHDPKYNGKFPNIVPPKEWISRTMVAGNGWIEKGLFYGADECNRIIRFEHDINAQLNQCLTDCGLDPVTLPVVGKTNHGHYSEYYDCELAVEAALRFHAELTEWGYRFETE